MARKVSGNHSGACECEDDAGDSSFPVSVSSNENSASMKYTGPKTIRRNGQPTNQSLYSNLRK